MAAQRVVVPDVLRTVIADQVARMFADRGADEVAAVLDALPREVPEGIVTAWCRGGPFGWRLDARLDIGPDGPELEVLEDSRMAGPQRVRILADGSRVHLEAPSSAYCCPKDATPQEKATAREAMHARNRRIDAELKARGF